MSSIFRSLATNLQVLRQLEPIESRLCLTYTNEDQVTDCLQTNSTEVQFSFYVSDEFKSASDYAYFDAALCYSEASENGLETRCAITSEDLRVGDPVEFVSLDTLIELNQESLELLAYESEEAEQLVSLRYLDRRLCISYVGGSEVTDLYWGSCFFRSNTDLNQNRLFYIENQLEFELQRIVFQEADEYTRLSGKALMYFIFQMLLLLGISSAFVAYAYKFGRQPLWMQDRIQRIKETVFQRGLTARELEQLRLENLGPVENENDTPRV